MSARGKRVAAPAETTAIALSLARAGWPVFPVTIYLDDAGKRSKVPAVPKGTSWKDWATTDETKIADEWPAGCWIGVHAGAAGIVVMDVDLEPASGFKSLKKAGLQIVETPVAYDTLGGGRHYVYAAPDGVDLTIARGLVYDGKPLAGVDVRSGAGLMIYYGPELDGAPALPAAPDWLLVTRERPATGDGTDRAPSADEDALRERLVPGKPSPEVRDALSAVRSRDMGHEDMLVAVTALVGLGVKGHPGVAEALDEGRETYSRGWPDAGRHWDNAVQGSVRRLGLPPVTLALTKTERREIKKRNKPEAIEARKAGRETVADPIGSLDDANLPVVVADHFRDVLSFVAGGWLKYDGMRWADVSHEHVLELVRAHLEDLGADHYRRREDRVAVWLRRKTTIVNAAQLIRGILERSADAFDADPDVLNTPSGIVHLPTGEVRPHDPALLLTKVTRAPYKPGATHEDWETALEALPKKTRDWMQIRAGQAATGHTPDDDRLIIGQGTGENGKSTYFAALLRALGDYAIVAPERLLLAAPGDTPLEIMSLQGVRLAISEELPEGRRLSVKRLKDTIGTPTLKGRRLYRDYVEFVPTHTLMMSTNYEPEIAETDHGTWRRLAFVRFPYRYVNEPVGDGQRKADRRLRSRLEGGRGGRDAAVLAWVIEGARRWYDAGMRTPEPPARVLDDTDALRATSDLVMAFANDSLVFGPDAIVSTTGLAERFRAWLSSNGHTAWSQRLITSRLKSHEIFTRNRVQYAERTIGGTSARVWLGVGLRPNEAVLDSFVTPTHHTN
ncbi:phage/plasmid primase, P4 family [uncultured Microbacterium sp.]|uniref:phage/plasmid primase, P4 family n=1 Tax=uncultured Microbacterium sp. TaxID=191216 RepID=UPI0028E4739D|nr:phage/plasmid primase, P4 family [uncultured Microbacterium sp.]